MSSRLLRLGLMLGLFMLCAAAVATPSAAAGAVVENDQCVAATPIGEGVYTGTTTGATPDGADSCAGTAGDVWYLYTASCDGIVEIQTCGSTFDTVISVEAAGCTGAEEHCNDEWCGNQSGLYDSVVSGEQKLIRISGWEHPTDPSWPSTGDYTLSVTCMPTPVNDSCADAVPLAVPSTVSGTTKGATVTARSIEWCPANALDTWVSEPGVWYTVVGTGNRMVASTCNPGTTLNTKLGVYCDGCDELICAAAKSYTGPPEGPWYDPACDIGSGSNDASTVSWCSRAGQLYRILVHAWPYFPIGDFELSVADTGTPCWRSVDCTPVDVVQTVLEDNGDDDGWADTLETVNLRFSLFNRSETDLTGLRARLTTDDPRIACIANPEIALGELAAGETELSSGAFTFRVADVDRSDPLEDFTGSLKITLASDQFQDLETPRCSVNGEACSDDSQCTNDDVCENMVCHLSQAPCHRKIDCWPEECVGTCSRTGWECYENDSFEVPWYGSIVGCEGPDVCVDESQELRLDLDLDATGGSGSTTFFEGFESGGFGSFTTMNLDAGLATPSAAKGYRCQWYNPDAPHGYSLGLDCPLAHGDAAFAEDYFWQVDDDRAFTGRRALYMGRELPSGDHTTPLAALEAIRTTDPVSLGWARSCSASGIACTDARDCPEGEDCHAAVPELSFKHQISLVRAQQGVFSNVFYGLDRGVVQVQLADAVGRPLGDWQTVTPYWNGYHIYSQSNFFGCMFDPTDDGNTEDDFFEPTDPARVYGPSSTCFPELTFSNLGETGNAFAPENTFAAKDGPGLRGQTGLGTWVESKVSLAPFRGRRIRLRFLSTSFTIPDLADSGVGMVWPDFYPAVGPLPIDDGWWIDDVKISHALVEPTTLAVDVKDNTALAADADGDCVEDELDCDDGNDTLWFAPGEVQDLHLSHGGGPGGTTTLSWTEPGSLGGSAVRYVTLVRGPGLCTESPVVSGTTATDGTTPASRDLHQFLVFAENDCGLGSLGRGSNNDPREHCP